ncbi:MAG: hypothetical protein JW882_05905 [Deltaproteobacteria bacterium]|nr:hypothetical protein [Deltaproteobacteria bacterium]
MMEPNNEKYIVRKPLYKHGGCVKNKKGPSMTYMSNTQVPGVNHYLEYRWVYGIPEPDPYLHEHVNDFSKIMLYIGGDYSVPEDLGGEIELSLGGQKLMFGNTSAIFIPAGESHSQAVWKKFKRPHIQMMIILGSGEDIDLHERNGVEEAGKGLSQKKDNVDYERYLVRKPVYERSGGIKNRQSPTMTFISANQVPEAEYYLEFGWIYGIPEPNPHIPEHVHENDEIVLHFGGDPEKPEDLGGMIELHVGGKPLLFDTTTAIFAPKGLYHCPVIWREFRKPHVEMAITLGSGRR